MTSLTSAAPAAALPIPVSDRFVARDVKLRPGAASRAAWLVLLAQDEGTRALLFNAEQRYLSEVIDDPLAVERLCSAGRRCEPPPGLLRDAALPSTDAANVTCFSLGDH